MNTNDNDILREVLSNGSCASSSCDDTKYFDPSKGILLGWPGGGKAVYTKIIDGICVEYLSYEDPEEKLRSARAQKLLKEGEKILRVD